MKTIKVNNNTWIELETGFYSVQKHKGTKYLLAAGDVDDVLNDNVCEVEDLTDLTDKQYSDLSEALFELFGVKLNGEQGRKFRSVVSWEN